ncbi:hypothetical protein [Spiroplasma endosymbiont of Crioceris asparagi]|uniref:hypothetical protein n=1 Tax=Spiroplasma endosymbiont of Crioceris asparagi TaxID=3066286 RepID=UPI0030CEEC1E
MQLHIVSFLAMFDNQKLAISVIVILSFLTIILLATWILFVNKRKNALENFINFKTQFKQHQKPIDYFGGDVELAAHFYETTFSKKNTINNMFFEEKRIHNSKIIVENFLDLKKIIEINEQINFIEGKIIINAKNMTFNFKDKQIVVNLEDVFYYSGFYEPKNNVLFLKLNFFDQNNDLNIIFQMKYYEDLNTFIQINNLVN